MSMSTPQGGSSKSDPGSIRVTGKSANAAGKPGAGKASDAKATPAKAGDAKAGDAKVSDAKATPGKATPGKATGGKATGGQRPGAPRPSGGGNRPGGPRRPITPVVKPARNWSTWIIAAVVLVIAGSIVGYAGYQLYQDGISPEDRA